MRKVIGSSPISSTKQKQSSQPGWLFFVRYGIPDIGLERRLLATCRWQVATAVAFPQKSESIPAKGRSFISSTRNKTVDSAESAVFVSYGWFMGESIRFEGKDLPMRSSGPRHSRGSPAGQIRRLTEQQSCGVRRAFPVSITEKCASRSSEAAEYSYIVHQKQSSRLNRVGCFYFAGRYVREKPKASP